MQINYNEWLLLYHKYLTGKRDGKTSFNDTTWNTINERMTTLIDLNSQLLNKQPYGVIGNYTGFQQLTDLMEASNYTFEDLDQSLIQTYKQTLKNAMSRMVVNTHAVIAHYNCNDDSIKQDTQGYYSIDVPFMQLHFGERDEFIRQRLHEFYETENQHYVDADTFESAYLSDILDFSLICTVNGFMSNDWKVGVDEKGFHFKIRWARSADCDIIIYKLDHSSVVTQEVNVMQWKRVSPLNDYTMPYSMLHIPDYMKHVGQHCIVQIMDKNTAKTAITVPNFATFTTSGLYFRNVQKKTYELLQSDAAIFRIYVCNYLHEIPEFYPAVDYYALIERRHIYDDMGHRVTNPDGNYIVGSYNVHPYESQNVCTPPISVDRTTSSNASSLLVEGSTIYDRLRELEITIKAIEKVLLVPEETFNANIEKYYRDLNSLPLLQTLVAFNKINATYKRLAISTSCIPSKLVTTMDDFRNHVATFLTHISLRDDLFQTLHTNDFDELYHLGYEQFVMDVCRPLQKPPFTMIGNALKNVTNYFDDEALCVNRPISEQCLIALMYDPDEECWKFAYPEIQHFKGVGNTFYVNGKLKGSEVFKFFYLYTDTENPAEQSAIEMNDSTILDYDAFVSEVSRHIGYIKYWNVESKLMKLSHMYYGEHNHDTELAILSKILKRKIDGELLYEYPSEINYEMSNVSSDNLHADEFDIRAPFALNFLFYTVAMLYENKDQMLAYFVRMLTKQKFIPRYADLKISDLHPELDTEAINYGVVNEAPSDFTAADTRVGTGVFNGVPIVFDTNGIHVTPAAMPGNGGTTPYRYVFNQYENQGQHYQLANGFVDEEKFVQYADISATNLKRHTFYSDGRIASKLLSYIAEVYTYISQIQTNYTITWNLSSLLDEAINMHQRYRAWFVDFARHMDSDTQFNYSSTWGTVQTLFTSQIGNDPIYHLFYMIRSHINSLSAFTDREGHAENIRDEVDTLIKNLRLIHTNIGFDYKATRIARSAYLKLKEYQGTQSMDQLTKWASDMMTNPLFDEAYQKHFSLLEYQPGNWNTEYMKFYVKQHDGRYTRITSINAPTFEPNTYYTDADSTDPLNHITRITFYDACSPYIDDPAYAEWKNVVQRMDNDMNTKFVKWGLPGIKTYADESIRLIQSLYDDAMAVLAHPIEVCQTIIHDYVFDLFAIQSVTILPPETPYTKQTNSRPEYVEILIDTSDPHVHLPYQTITPANEFATLLFKVVYHETATTIELKSLIPVCEYAFYNGDAITVENTSSETYGIKIRCYDQNFNDVTSNAISSAITITFKKVSSSTDMLKSFTRYIGDQSIPIEIANRHETFDIDENHLITNQKHASLNYELLVGNRFMPVTHQSEFITNRDALDKVYLSCAWLNQYSQTGREDDRVQMYFKACQVLHMAPDLEQIVTSAGGKYFQNQTLYAQTDDGLCIFPIKVTWVDHAEQHGMIEAEVDAHHAPWFKTSDLTVIDKYLTQSIECVLLDDNIRNFLDEYSEYLGDYYPIPQFTNSAQIYTENADVYTMPGDPVYVANNSEYVYTRLNWMMHDEIPDRVNSSINPLHHFVYIGSGAIDAETHSLSLSMLHHDFNPFTYQEMYPILRDEPNDHSVWKAEWDVMREESQRCLYLMQSYQAKMIEDRDHMLNATTLSEKQTWDLKFTSDSLRYAYYSDYYNRITLYAMELERPTTWYNVQTYESALVYINNGRAHLAKTVQFAKRDIVYGDNIELKLYDWQNKRWIPSQAYEIDIVKDTISSIDEPESGFLTSDVQHTMTITFTDQTIDSKHVLIYFVYNTSDICDDIQMHDPICTVQFKPQMMIRNEQIVPDDVYRNTMLRKHFDESETYQIASLETPPDDFPYENGAMFTRPTRSGLYTYGSPIRFGDMTVVLGGTDYTCEDFDIYTRTYFDNVNVPHIHRDVQYASIMYQPIDGFVPNKRITLISIQNNTLSEFNGVSSSVMFTAETYIDENERNAIRIIESSAYLINGASFLCTVKPDTSHPMSGGMITINVTVTESEVNVTSKWFKVTDPEYQIIPEQVILIPKDTTLDVTSIEKITLQNQYVLDADDNIDPYTYYYDKSRHIRYPISDVSHNKHDERLEIDETLNPDVSKIRANYIGICRYAARTFPQDGIIDLTGYIPTPLSRDRYEIWVNGRCVSSTDSLVILSPTVFQLRYMTSLRNLEVIELVDDVHDSSALPRGTTYVDMDGNHYASYHLAMNQNIVDESIQYRFNQNVADPIDTYIPDQVRDSHNRDIETDIMSYIVFPDNPVTDYGELNHIPSIDGEPLFHETTESLGFMELSNHEVIRTFDRVWKKEILNGEVPISHAAGLELQHGVKQFLHVIERDDAFEVFTTGVVDQYFTLFISNSRTAPVDSESATLKIIPFIRTGVHVMIPKTYRGKYIRSTVPNTKAIQI